MSLLLISLFSGAIAIAVAVFRFDVLRKKAFCVGKMAEVASAIALGVRTYLSRQLKTILLITPFVAALLWRTVSLSVAITFVLGVFTSLVTAFLV